MPDVLEGRSESARRAVSMATVEARQLGHPAVGTEHLLLGLLRDDGVAAAALTAAGATLTAARHSVVEVVARGDEERVGLLPFSPRAQRALDRAARFSRQDHHPEVDSPHILLGVLDVEGLGCQVLRGIGVDVVRLRDSLLAPTPVTVPTDDVAGAAPAPAPGAAPGPAPNPTERRDDTSPTCPWCSARLSQTLAVRRLPVRGSTGVDEVDVAYCQGCGTALGPVTTPGA